MTATLIAPSEADSAAVLLSISGLRLLLPQEDVRALEAATGMDTNETKPFSVGWVRLNGERWPVYCLSAELSLLIVAPKERRSCLVLNTGAGYIGILCDEFRVGQTIAPEQRQPLPPAMRLPASPVLGLAAIGENEVACCTSAEALVEHVTRQVNL